MICDIHRLAWRPELAAPAAWLRCLEQVMASEETPSELVRKTNPSPPRGRIYRHPQCGRLTEISGHNFLRLANPFAVAFETICCGCGRAVPVRHVEWADTGENVVAYRKRLRAATPLGRRLMFALLGGTVGALIGFVCGYAGGVLMIGRMGNRPWWFQEAGLIAAPLTAFGGCLIGAQLLTAPMMRLLWGIDYRGTR